MFFIKLITIINWWNVFWEIRMRQCLLTRWWKSVFWLPAVNMPWFETSLNHWNTVRSIKRIFDWQSINFLFLFLLLSFSNILQIGGHIAWVCRCESLYGMPTLQEMSAHELLGWLQSVRSVSMVSNITIIPKWNLSALEAFFTLLYDGSIPARQLSFIISCFLANQSTVCVFRVSYDSFVTLNWCFIGRWRCDFTSEENIYFFSD